MTPDPKHLDAVHQALDAAAGLDPDEALPHLREAADRLTELIDESMAEAVLQGKASLRSAGRRGRPHGERRRHPGWPAPRPSAPTPTRRAG